MTILNSISLLEKRGIPHRVIELPRPPRNAQDIVILVGCRLDQVIKTLLFVGDKNVLACVPGDRRVDPHKLCQVVGAEHLRLASPYEVRSITGLEIGGVCPFLPLREVGSVLDRECTKKTTVNIGAGTRTTGIEVAADDLTRIWPGIVADIVQSQL